MSLFGVSAFGRVLVPVNFRLNAEEIRYIFEHSGATWPWSIPRSTRRAQLPSSTASCSAPPPTGAVRRDAAPRGRVTDENATVSVNYTSGTTARPKGVQLTHRGCWLNAVTFGWHVGVTDRDVYLHTLPMFHCNGWGMPYALTAMGARQVIIRKIDGEEILRRIDAHGVTLFNCAPAVIAAVLDAAAARAGARRGVPGAGRVRVVVAGAPPPSKTIERSRPSSAGSSSRSTASPRPRRCSRSTGAPGVGRDRPARARAAPVAGRRAGRRRAHGGRRERRDPRALQQRVRGLLEPARGDGEGAGRRLVPHRRRRPHRGRLRRDRRPQEGRDHHRRRERVIDRGRGLPLPASRRRRGRRDRRPRREVGRDHQGARGAAAGDPGERRAT